MPENRDKNWGATLGEQATAAGPGTRREATMLDLLDDISIELSVEIGRAKLTIAQILKLSPGDVVELDDLAGEPVKVYVNQILIAHGEIVTVNDRFGIRLTYIVLPRDRAKREVLNEL